MKKVGSIGPTNCKIAIVGEAPGTEEVRVGIPFVGASGRLLDECLHKAGISREECYITNVVKIQPPGNDITRLGELGLTKEQFYPELQEELGLLQGTNIIIALGNTPLEALTGNFSVSKWRGSILPNTLTHNGPKIIPTLHPAFCLRNYKETYLLTHDLSRAKKQAVFPDIIKRNRTYIINPTFDTCINYLKKFKVEGEYLSVDLETYMRSGLIKMIGLSINDEEAIAIPLLRNMRSVWTRNEEAYLWELIVPLLLSKKVIAQNAQFEMTQLASYTGGMLKPWMDTMRAHALLYPEFPHSLSFMTSIYTDMSYYKDDGKITGTKEESQWDKLCTYNCKDVLATYEIAMELEQELKETRLHDFYHQYDKPLLQTLWNMSMRGVNVNQEKVEKFRKKIDQDIGSLKDSFIAMTGCDVNVKSSKQMCHYLYDVLRLPKKFKKGSLSTTANEEALEELYRQTKDESIHLLLEQRRLRTLKETFLDMKTSVKDNKIHTVYGLTKSGRLSSSKDLFGTGANLQNIPKKKGKWIRGAFTPTTGKILLSGDLSQAEARVVAWLAEDTVQKQIFTSGKDIHKLFAALLFSVEYEAVTEEQREKAKTLKHAKNYGMGPIQIAKRLNVSNKEAQFLIAEDDSIFPNIKGVFQREVTEKIRTAKRLITPWGRHRYFVGRLGDELLREAYSYIPQSVVADIINNTLCALAHPGVLPIGASILMQVHDEIVLECYLEQVEEVSWLLRYLVEIPLLIKGDILTIPVEIKTGVDWANMKELR